MFSKYLIGFVGVTTVAGGAVATTIALKKGKNETDNKEKNTEGREEASLDSKDSLTVEGPESGLDTLSNVDSPSAKDESEETDGDDENHESSGDGLMQLPSK